jgi:iron complex outermembrane receptor protein
MPGLDRLLSKCHKGLGMLSVVLAVLFSADADAQRVDENAVKEADDAFGVTIGREVLGLYATDFVRGFSPTDAGNARINGLYFDQVWAPNARVCRATTIRIGPSAQGYPFPAPTGIVDHELKSPEADASLSVLISADEWGGRSIEADAVLPLPDQALSIGVGGSAQASEFPNGTDGMYHSVGGSLRWRPTPTLEIMPFGARLDGKDDEYGPIFIPSGPFLPPRMPERQFDGPSWVDYEGSAITYGALANYRPSERWQVRFGAFRSLLDSSTSFAHLLLNLQPDGTAQRLIVADPPTKLASTSGELRLTRSMTEGSLFHQFHLNVRARDRTTRYDGSVAIDLGSARPGLAVTAPKPAFEFGSQTFDRVEQQLAGFAYELRWAQRGQLGVGLQRSHYAKSVERPDTHVESNDESWLPSMSAAYLLRPSLTAYASYTRGLEESGTAPNSARNRGEALPAIRTRQADAGVRYTFTQHLKLIAGVFEVRKPYFTLDGENRFRPLGDVRHRGVEISISGSARDDLDIVAGAVLLDAEVSGPDVTNGEVGSRPVGRARREFLLTSDWRVPVLQSLSLDVGAQHTSSVPATLDNLVELPSRTLVNLGGRYRFRVAGTPATLRLSIVNVTSAYGYILLGSGVYSQMQGRLASAYITLDL